MLLVIVQSLSRVLLFRDPMDCGPPGSSAHGNPQVKVLQWAGISPSRDLPDPGLEPTSPALTGGFFTTEPPGKIHSLTVAKNF